MGPHRSIHSLLRNRQISDPQRDQPTSGYSSASSTCASSPVSSVFSLARKPSSGSLSSTSSSPVMSDMPKYPLATKRSVPTGLEDVAEDPMEPELSANVSRSPVLPHYSSRRSRRSHDIPKRAHAQSLSLPRWSSDRQEYCYDTEAHNSKRRKSVEQPWTSFTNGVFRSLTGSLSRRPTHIRQASTPIDERRSRMTVSPSPTPLSLSRSVSRNPSRNQSCRNSIEMQFHESQQGLGIQVDTIMEDEPQIDQDPIPFPTYAACRDSNESDGSEIERRPTPLLPRFLDQSATTPPPDSLLQSPTIARETQQRPASIPMTPARTPTIPSPALSHQASSSDARRSISNNQRPLSGISPLRLSQDKDDFESEWRAKLGHMNFILQHEPYFPTETTPPSYEKLNADWQKAADEYAVWFSNTKKHYGESSKICVLTQEKWKALEGRWRSASEWVFQELLSKGEQSYPSPIVPAQVAQLADTDDPRLIRDGQIVGPMAVDPPAAPPVARRSTSTRDKIKSFMMPKKRSSSLSRG